MRKSRLRKFRKKNKTLSVVAKLVAIGYGCTLTVTFLSASTSASFTSSAKQTIEIQAGSWWDKSELEFVKNHTVNDKSCPPSEIKVQIKNTGFSMTSSTTYEVFYSEEGNPKNQGTVVADGVIEPIASGETVELTFKAEKIGSYRFKANQLLEYEGKYPEVWSEKIMVKCLDEKKQKNYNEKEEKGESKEDSQLNMSDKTDTNSTDQEQTNADTVTNEKEAISESAQKDTTKKEQKTNEVKEKKEAQDAQEASTTNVMNETNEKQDSPKKQVTEGGEGKVESTELINQGKLEEENDSTK